MLRLSERIQLCLVLLTIFSVSSSADVENNSIAKTASNFQVLEADHPYKLKVKQNDEMYFTFDVQSSNQTELTIDIQSSGTFQLCVLDQNRQCSSPASTYRKKQSSLKLTEKQIVNGIKIKNLSFLFKLKLYVSFHFDKDLCHLLQTSRLHRKELSHTNCYSFELKQVEDVVLLVGKEHFMDLSYQFTLCGSKIKNEFKEGQDQFFFKKEYIKEICDGAASFILSVSIIDRQYDNLQESKAIQGSTALVTLALQYSKEPILLPDGIAYHSSQQYINNGRKTFYFQLLNIKNTSINVITRSQIEIYVKVVNESQKDSSVPDRDNFDFSSKSGEIFTYFRPYMLITQQKLKQFSCDDCYLVVQVFMAAESTDSLTIEITQQMSILENGKMKHHFLVGSSIAYYQYAPKISTTVTYELADNNKNCAVFYLSTSQLPGPSNSLETSFNNRIIYKSISNTVYYIGVEAKVDCAYSLVATDSTNEVTLLEKGRFGYLNMAKGQIKYFLIKAEASQYIKLLSLHVYGKVQIYLNRSASSSTKQFNSANINISTFQMKGQFMNRLILYSNSNLYCSNCYYLIAVVALKVTESTLFFGDEKTPIPIHDKIINDMILQKGSKVTGQYYGELRFELQVKIHSGKLRLKITNGKQTFESLFEETQVVVTNIVDLGKKTGLLQIIFSLFDFDPVTVEFTAQEDNTVYSVRFTDSNASIGSTTDQSGKTTTGQQAQKDKPHTGKKIKLEAGQSRQFSLQEKQQTCIDGYLKDKTQKFLISSYVDEKEKLSGLNFSLKVSDKTLEYTIEIIQNVMTLSIPSLENYYISKAIPYTLCLTTNSSDPFWISFMQTEDFSLLPSEVDTIVRGQYTFVTHTQAPLIVDIFQCRGKSTIAYNQNRQKLKQKAEHHLDIIGLQNQPHAVRINTLSTTFYKIDAPLAIVRWFPFLIEKGIGTGYLDYGIGKLHYESGVFGITLIWQSLFKERQTNSSISSADFTLYISSSSSDLQSGSQCQSFLQSDTWQIKNIVDLIAAKQLNRAFSYTFKKGELVDRFGQNVTLYSTVVIDLFLRPLGDQDQENDGQRYRFIYPQVQIPGQILSKGYISSMTFAQFIIVIILGFIALVVFIYLLLRKILPLLGILKNRYLVEENEQQGADPVEKKVVSEGQNDLIVPPSSERQGVQKFNSMMNQYEEEENN